MRAIATGFAWVGWRRVRDTDEPAASSRSGQGDARFNLSARPSACIERVAANQHRRTGGEIALAPTTLLDRSSAAERPLWALHAARHGAPFARQRAGTEDNQRVNASGEQLRFIVNWQSWAGLVRSRCYCLWFCRPALRAGATSTRSFACAGTRANKRGSRMFVGSATFGASLESWTRSIGGRVQMSLWDHWLMLSAMWHACIMKNSQRWCL